MQLIKARATHATDVIAYLDEHGVDHSVAGGGDAGRDDAEAQRLQRPAHLGHGVPAPAAPQLTTATFSPASVTCTCTHAHYTLKTNESGHNLQFDFKF